MVRFSFGLLAACAALCALAANPAPAAEQPLDPIVCYPNRTAAAPPYPTIIWNHGRAHSKAEYERGKTAWRKMCEIMAASENAIIYMPVRPDLTGPENIPKEFDMVMAGIDAAKRGPDVDPARIALMGHSRGALLAMMAAVARSDLAAIILTAPADIAPYGQQTAARLSAVSAPVLLMVEKGDDEGGLDGFAIFTRALRDAGKEHRAILFDKGGGHGLFRMRDYWWADFETFLVDRLKVTPSAKWYSNKPADSTLNKSERGKGIEAMPATDPSRRNRGRDR